MSESQGAIGPLYVLRGAFILSVVLFCGVPVLNGVRIIGEVNFRHHASPGLIGLPAWLPVLFSLVSLAVLTWTWARQRIIPDLNRLIALAAVVIPVTGTMYRGWWALPVGGLTLILLAGRSVARRRQHRAAEAQAAAERVERRAERARRQRERELRGRSDLRTQGHSGSPPQRRKRARG